MSNVKPSCSQSQKDEHSYSPVCRQSHTRTSCASNQSVVGVFNTVTCFNPDWSWSPTQIIMWLQAFLHFQPFQQWKITLHFPFHVNRLGWKYSCGAPTGLGNASFLRRNKKEGGIQNNLFDAHPHTHTLCYSAPIKSKLACPGAVPPHLSPHHPTPHSHNEQDGITVVLKAFAWQSNIVHLRNKRNWSCLSQVGFLG